MTALRGFGSKYDGAGGPQRGSVFEKWMVIGTVVSCRFNRHTITKGILERKGSKDATVALSGFESKYDSMVAISNFLGVAFFHAGFARGTFAQNFLDFTKINYDRTCLPGDSVFFSVFYGQVC